MQEDFDEIAKFYRFALTPLPRCVQTYLTSILKVKLQVILHEFKILTNILPHY